MNSSIDIDKRNLFLGYYYGVGELLSKGFHFQPGMYFINGETNSIWVWDALERRWIDTNRVDSGLKGMLTDREGNSPADYQPNQTKGIKESYFYVAECEDVDANPGARAKTVTFTYFKNGASSVSVTVRKTSIVTLFWNGDYWETSVVPMYVDLSKVALAEDVEEIRASLKSNENSLTWVSSNAYELKRLPFTIGKGAKVFISGDVSVISGRTNEGDSEYQVLRNGDVADRNITYIKNMEGVGELILSVSEGGIMVRLDSLEKDSKNYFSKIESLNKLVVGEEEKIYSLTRVDFPARYDGSETISGYFRGYKVDLSPFVAKYDEVYFRGAEFKKPEFGNEACRGIVVDKNGVVESSVDFVDVNSNGWQSLPITENSQFLWASYCNDVAGGEVWNPEYVTVRNVGEEGLLSKVESIENEIGNFKTVDSISVLLPAHIYIPQGKISQLFFRGFVKAVSPYKYDIKVMCSKGKTFPRYYEFGKNIPVGDYPITVQVRNDNLNVLGEAKSVVHVIDVKDIATSVNVLCVGASATATGCWAAELNRLLHNENIHFVGAKNGSKEDVSLEATPGWSWNDFISVDAPFANANFKSYANQYCGGTIDLLIAHIGVNNSLWENSNEKGAIGNARNFIDGYFKDFPNGKMIVTAIPMPDEGTNVYENSTSENNINRYGTLSSFLRYNKALYDLVGELKGKYNISYAPTNLFFDADYGYPKEHKNVNTRMCDYKEMVGVNGVHPIPEGSYMIADGILPVFYKMIVE